MRWFKLQSTRWLGLLGFWLLAAMNLFAQQVTITGQVNDETGQPMPGFTVVANDGKAGAVTDNQGRYTIRLTAPDSVVLVFQALEFRTVRERVELQPGKTNYVLNVNMEAEAVTLGTVTVTEQFKQSLERSVGSMAVIETKSIDRMAATTVVEAVNQIPGVSFNDDQPSIRGSSGYSFGAGSRVITCLNGLPMITPETGSVNFDLLPSDNIQQVEVLKGASSVLYGAGAMGGVINVITADPTDVPYTSIRLRCKFFDSPANPAADFDGRSAGVLPSIHVTHARKIGSDYDVSLQADMMREGGYRVGENQQRMRLMLMNTYRVPKFKGLSIGLNVQANMDSGANFIAWSGYPEGALIPGAGFLSRQYLTRFSLDPKIMYTGSRTQHILQGRLYSSSNQISTGQSGDYKSYYIEYLVKRQFLKDALQLAGGVNYIFSDVFSQAAFGQANSNQAAAYAQLKWNITRRLDALVGVRYQYENVTGDTAIASAEKGNPLNVVTRTTLNEPIFRLGVNFNPLPGTYLRGSFGQAVRSPSVAERFTTTQAGPISVVPNPNIQLEKGFTGEVGIMQLYKYRRIRGFVDLAGFVTQFQNMVEFSYDPRFPGINFASRNLTNVSILGGEGSWLLDVKINRLMNLTFSGGVTYIYPRDNGGDPALNGDTARYTLTDAFTGRLDRPTILKYRNNWLTRSSVDLKIGIVSLAINHRYTSHMVNVDKLFMILLQGSREFRAVNDRGFHVFDFILSIQHSQTTVSLHAFNAFNAEYMTIPGNLGEQRSFAIQVKQTFGR
jgi:iron complex outermembrane receptor protein